MPTKKELWRSNDMKHSQIIIGTIKQKQLLISNNWFNKIAVTDYRMPLTSFLGQRKCHNSFFFQSKNAQIKELNKTLK